MLPSNLFVLDVIYEIDWFSLGLFKYLQETKKPVHNSSSILIEKVSNKVIIDVDEYRADSSFSDPMFVKHIEAIIDEVKILEDIDLM
ncbi:hypothetical protein MKW92_016316, partial [Papaver armeniacum]